MLNWIIVAAAVIWLYVLTVLKRTKLDGWYFVVGSAGLFVLALITLQPILLQPIQKAVAASAGVLGNLTGTYTSFFQNSLVFVSHGDMNISMYVDFECSGIIESFALLALLWFFPAYQLYEKIIVSVIGCVTIFVSNVLRIFLICLCLYFFGEGSYFFAHTILGRFFFYACTIVLYFYVFTRSQVVRQRVGAFKYDNNQ